MKEAILPWHLALEITHGILCPLLGFPVQEHTDIMTVSNGGPPGQLELEAHGAAKIIAFALWQAS